MSLVAACRGRFASLCVEALHADDTFQVALTLMPDDLEPKPGHGARISRFGGRGHLPDNTATVRPFRRGSRKMPANGPMVVSEEFRVRPLQNPDGIFRAGFADVDLNANAMSPKP